MGEGGQKYSYGLFKSWCQMIRVHLNPIVVQRVELAQRGSLTNGLNPSNFSFALRTILECELSVVLLLPIYMLFIHKLPNLQVIYE